LTPQIETTIKPKDTRRCFSYQRLGYIGSRCRNKREVTLAKILTLNWRWSEDRWRGREGDTLEWYRTRWDWRPGWRRALSG